MRFDMVEEGVLLTNIVVLNYCAVIHCGGFPAPHRREELLPVGCVGNMCY